MQKIVEGSGSVTQGTFLDPAEIAKGAGVELLDGDPQVDSGVSIRADEADFLKRQSADIDAAIIVENRVDRPFGDEQAELPGIFDLCRVTQYT